MTTQAPSNELRQYICSARGFEDVTYKDAVCHIAVGPSERLVYLVSEAGPVIDRLRAVQRAAEKCLDSITRSWLRAELIEALQAAGNPGAAHEPPVERPDFREEAHETVNDTIFDVLGDDNQSLAEAIVKALVAENLLAGGPYSTETKGSDHG